MFFPFQEINAGGFDICESGGLTVRRERRRQEATPLCDDDDAFKVRNDGNDTWKSDGSSSFLYSLTAMGGIVN